VGEDKDYDDDDQSLEGEWKRALQKIGPQGHRQLISQLLALASRMEGLERNVLKELVLGDDPRTFLAAVSLVKPQTWPPSLTHRLCGG
jgi:hypothetical protein